MYFASRTFMVAALVAAAATAACSLPATAASSAVPIEIEIAKFGFAPKEITVAPGARIVWINHDETPHTVTSVDKKFGSKGMDTDDTFVHTFDTEGDFNYLCTVHPFMTGVVHVRRQ